MKKEIESKYMMATTAVHRMGDLSREKPSLCCVFQEDDDNYYGNWVSGYGFCEVQFPKQTTKELTPGEVEHWHGEITRIGNSFGPTINITGENFNKKVLVTKKETGEFRSGTLIAPVKVGKSIALINLDDGRTFCSTRIESINGNEVKTRNSTYIVEYIDEIDNFSKVTSIPTKI
jgi:hypothetical protein